MAFLSRLLGCDEAGCGKDGKLAGLTEGDSSVNLGCCRCVGWSYSRWSLSEPAAVKSSAQSGDMLLRASRR